MSRSGLLIRVLLIAHIAALAFGLAGLLIALPHPELWRGSANAQRVYDFGMSKGGSTHILFGAAAVFAFAWRYLGGRKTLIFFLSATLLSLGSELVGTGTGWPFGNYEYTDFLGLKVMGRVPFTIPLSWFYMGLTSLLLASVITSRLPRTVHPVWTVLLGVYFLTAWDLVLDPAMASDAMSVKFWVWHQTGPYFGMPVKNLAGWSLTGLAFMALARALWQGPASVERLPIWFPLIIYTANMIFAMALSLSVGLWQPAVMAVLFGLAPAAFALRGRLGGGGSLRPRAATLEGVAR